MSTCPENRCEVQTRQYLAKYVIPGPAPYLEKPNRYDDKSHSQIIIPIGTLLLLLLSTTTTNIIAIVGYKIYTV